MKASSISTSSERLVVSKTDEHDGVQQHLDKVIPAKSTRRSFVLILEDRFTVETRSFIKDNPVSKLYKYSFLHSIKVYIHESLDERAIH